MKIISSIFIFTFLFITDLQPQAGAGIPGLTKDDLPGIKKVQLREFQGESLYGYMDGGADLYLEYGFKSLAVSEFEYKKGKFKMEIFMMNGHEEAFGIFSVSRFRCRYQPPIRDCTCQTKYQLLICRGQYLISLINESGSKTDSAASIVIGEKMASKIKPSEKGLDQFFPGISSGKVYNDAILVKGKLGLANGADMFSGYFKDAAGYTAMIIPATEKNIISIRFENDEALLRFAELHSWSMERLSESGLKTTQGELIKKLNDNHVLIEINVKE